jgi:hypothetical protein
MEKQIYQAFGVPPELLKNKAPYDTSQLHRSVTLEIKSHRDDYFEKLRRLFESPYDRFKREFVSMIRDMGLHTDNVDKIRYVLDSEHGVPFVKQLTVEQTKDIEYLVQRLLAIYADMTS